MSQFRIKNNKYFRLEKGSSRTINNNIITDELALDFLQINPERIRLFEIYPQNWQDLIQDEQVEVEDEGVDEDYLRGQLIQFKMPELREKFPTVKQVSKDDFINDAIDFIKENGEDAIVL